MTKHAAEKSLNIQNRLFQEYQDAYYKTKNLPLALKKLEELLEITSLKQFVSYLIVDVIYPNGQTCRGGVQNCK